MPVNKRILASACLFTSGLTTLASGDFFAAVSVKYMVTAVDFGGQETTGFVQDIYVLSNDPTDTLLNIYNWNSAPGAPAQFFQSFTGTGWLPTNPGGPFDTDALQRVDSFVTIGGFAYDALQTPGTGAGVGVDPNFGGSTAAAPGVNAGWYNGNPPSLIGRPIETAVGLATLIGRFSSSTDYDLAGSMFEITWNNGLGSPGEQRQLTVLPGEDDDCNNNGVHDVFDVLFGSSFDVDRDFIPDECVISQSPELDCNSNGILDDPETAGFVFRTGWSSLTVPSPRTVSGPATPQAGPVLLRDLWSPQLSHIIISGHSIPRNSGLSGFYVPAEIWNMGIVNSRINIELPSTYPGPMVLIELSADLGPSTDDKDGDGIPDDCYQDCNLNGIADWMDIASGTSSDCDDDAVPDECQSLSDCNANGTPDVCEVADGAADCNANGVPDECDIVDGSSSDYDADGLPDDCEGGIVGTDYATIAEALLGVPDGGVIVVPGGIWGEQVVFDRPVLLIAPDGATILPKTQGPAVIADGAPVGATMVGFTIRGGSPSTASPLGGGIVGAESSIRLDGCIIRNNTGTDGGGARFQGGSPTIVDCRFLNNTSTGRGGGLRLIGCDAMVSNCSFEMNQALGASGFAIAATDGFPTLADLEVTFHAGQPLVFEEATNFPATQMTLDRLYVHDNDGNPLLFETDDPEFCTLTDSRICGNDGEPTIGPFAWGGENIIFSDRCPNLVVPDDADTIQLAIDTAIDGERIAVRPGAWDDGGLDLSSRDLDLVGVEDPFLSKPTITGPVNGSAMPGTALIRHFTISNGVGIPDLPGHSGVRVGGGLVLDDSEATVEDCEIFQNSADLGGGAFVRDGAVVFRDVYVAQNEASIDGGGIHVEGAATTTITLEGCLLITNSVPFETGTRSGGLDARGLVDPSSLILGDTAIAGNFHENLAQNPAGGSFTDLGGNSISLARDCDGNGVEDAADIGDFDRPDCNGNLVPDDCDIAAGLEDDCDGNGVPDECELADGAPDLDQDGVLDVCQDQLVFSVPDRFPTLGDAIDAATDGSRIQLAVGSYVGPFDLGAKNLEIIGDPADPTATTLETPGLNATVLRIAGGQDATTVIAGVTIENGVADTPEPGNLTLLVGGGVFINVASPVIEDCIIGTNTAARGGGVFLRDSEAVLRRVTIEGNSADAGGGGVWWFGGVVTMEDCTVRDNQSSSNGGGLRLATAGGSIINGAITGNLATDDGAGLWWQGSGAMLDLSQILITENIAGGEGGGVLAKSDAPGVAFTDSTVCDNAPDEIVGPYSDLGGNDLCVCPFDLNGDDMVGAADLGILLGSWGICTTNPCLGDLNFDGAVNAADLGPLLGAWGACP